jgi:hypothetical protein
MFDSSLIGVVDFANAGTAWLTPVASLDAADLPQTLDDIVEQFPERGKVTWFHCPPGIEAGSLWIFRVRESPTFGKSSKYTDRYMVDGLPAKLNRRVLCSFRTEAEARIKLTAGVDLTIDPRDKHFIRIADASLIGPVPLVMSAEGYATLDRAAQDSPIGINPLAKHQIVTLKVEGVLIEMLWPPNSSWKNDAELDWGNDQNVLGRALRCIAKLAAPEVSASLQLTSKAITQISSTVGASLLKPIDKYRLERATTLVNEIGASSDLVRCLETQLLALPQNLEAVERAKQAAIAEAIEAVRADEEQILGEKRSRRIQLEKEIEDLTSERNNAAEEHAQAQRELSDFYNDLDSSLADKLEELNRRPGKVVAESVILASVLRNLNSCPSAKTLPMQAAACVNQRREIEVASLDQVRDTAFPSWMF